MFVDELKIYASAGNGGDGVVRWHREKFKPKGGPAGGNGGHGGDVYVRAVKDLNRLAKYTGDPTFKAEAGTPGTNRSQHGHAGDDLYIEIPVGSRITDLARDRTFELTTIGETVKILKGGGGGLGNEHFKSSTNRAPEESTAGRPGESGEFLIEVALMVDVGFIGLPNAGKSTLLNALTNASSTVGAYPFTTTEPHLGSFFGYILADIPGLISGASAGKGLGHKFLRHISRTKTLLHLISLATEDPAIDYQTINNELSQYDTSLLDKEEWIILTKKDLVQQADIDTAQEKLAKFEKRVFVISENDPQSIKELQDALVQYLENQ